MKQVENGDARLIGHFANGSDEWHAVRQTGVGGSDVSVICGLNPWESAYTWAAKRLGRIPNEFKTSNAMEWGTRLESVILQKFMEEHPELDIEADAGTWHHKDREWQIANPDALAVDRDGNNYIIEIKTARQNDWFDAEGNPSVPVYYRTQVQWYLQTFGYSKAIVAVFFRSEADYREFVIDADPFEQDLNLKTVESMMTLINADSMPDYSAPFTSTLETVRKQHPDIDDVDIELGNVGQSFIERLAMLDDAERVADQLRAQVLGLMGNAKRGTVDGVVVVERRARKGGTPYLVKK